MRSKFGPVHSIQSISTNIKIPQRQIMREKLERENPWQRNPRSRTGDCHLHDQCQKSNDLHAGDASMIQTRIPLIRSEVEECRSLELSARPKNPPFKKVEKRANEVDERKYKPQIKSPEDDPAMSIREIHKGSSPPVTNWRICTRKQKKVKKKEEKEMRCKIEIKNLKPKSAKAYDRSLDGLLFWCRRSKWKWRLPWRSGISASSPPLCFVLQCALRMDCCSIWARSAALCPSSGPSSQIPGYSRSYFHLKVEIRNCLTKANSPREFITKGFACSCLEIKLSRFRISHICFDYDHETEVNKSDTECKKQGYIMNPLAKNFEKIPWNNNSEPNRRKLKPRADRPSYSTSHSSFGNSYCKSTDFKERETTRGLRNQIKERQPTEMKKHEMCKEE